MVPVTTLPLLLVVDCFTSFITSHRRAARVTGKSCQITGKGCQIRYDYRVFVHASRRKLGTLRFGAV